MKNESFKNNFNKKEAKRDAPSEEAEKGYAGELFPSNKEVVKAPRREQPQESRAEEKPEKGERRVFYDDLRNENPNFIMDKKDTYGLSDMQILQGLIGKGHLKDVMVRLPEFDISEEYYAEIQDLESSYDPGEELRLNRLVEEEDARRAAAREYTGETNSQEEQARREEKFRNDLEMNDVHYVIHHLPDYHLSHDYMVDHLIVEGHISAVMDNLEVFDLSGHTYNSIAREFIQDGKVDILIERLPAFSLLSDSIALDLIEKGHKNNVINNLDSFEYLESKDDVIRLELGF